MRRFTTSGLGFGVSGCGFLLFGIELWIWGLTSGDPNLCSRILRYIAKGCSKYLGC